MVERGAGVRPSFGNVELEKERVGAGGGGEDFRGGVGGGCCHRLNGSPTSAGSRNPLLPAGMNHLSQCGRGCEKW